MLSPRMTLPRRRAGTHRYRAGNAGWLLTLVAALLLTLTPQSAQAAPTLMLPTPPGERWRVIQGYACGTHNDWDRYSLDLAQVDGPTYGAPIRAAASGDVWHWESRSGTLILHHGGRFFTMYTHLSRAVTTQRGKHFEAGQTLGFAGDRATAGVPHLHFTAFTAAGDGWSNKQSLPLRFVEGYDLPEVRGCNQHAGTVLTAAVLKAPEISFQSQAQPKQWYRSDMEIGFTTKWAGGGLSQAWDSEPSADKPMFARATDGYARLADAGEGMHTLQVRVWGPDGKQSVATYGPLGYDNTPPVAPSPISEVTAPPGAIVVSWAAATDAQSGVTGYRVYVGTDPEGKNDWFTSEPSVTTNPLEPGRYLLRVQALDQAGNASAWVTLGTLTVASVDNAQAGSLK